MNTNRKVRVKRKVKNSGEAGGTQAAVIRDLRARLADEKARADHLQKVNQQLIQYAAPGVWRSIHFERGGRVIAVLQLLQPQPQSQLSIAYQDPGSAVGTQFRVDLTEVAEHLVGGSATMHTLPLFHFIIPREPGITTTIHRE